MEMTRGRSFENFMRCDYFNCDNQGFVFELAQKIGYDINDFVDKFMTSDFCARELDALYSWFQTSEPEDIMDYVLKEIEPEYSSETYSNDKLHWIGYMYRYINLRFGINSSEIYKVLPMKDMLVLYVGMHTQDDEYFIDVISDKFRR